MLGKIYPYPRTRAIAEETIAALRENLIAHGKEVTSPIHATPDNFPLVKGEIQHEVKAQLYFTRGEFHRHCGHLDNYGYYHFVEGLDAVDYEYLQNRKPLKPQDLKVKEVA